MDIQFIDEKYKDDMKRLGMYCFSMNQEDVDEIFDESFNRDNAVGAFDGEKLAAMVGVLPYEIYFGGREAKMGGIGMVSTFPEYRNRHCIADILVKSLEIMKERDQIFSMLGPFSYAFYRKYGWELGFHTKQYTFDIDDFKKFKALNGSFRPISGSDIDDIYELYAKFARRYNGCVKRSRKSWEDRLKDQDKDRIYRYGFADDNDHLKGYIFYKIKGEEFQIREMVYSSIEAKHALFRFIYVHSAQVDKVVWNAPLDDNTLLLLDDPGKTVRLEAGMMVRAVDVQKILELYPFKAEYSGKFSIKVDDPNAKWNDQVFEVEVMNGKPKVKCLGEAKWDMRLSIQTFSQLAIGYIGLDDAIEAGKVELAVDSQQTVDNNVFYSQHTFLNDFF